MGGTVLAGASLAAVCALGGAMAGFRWAIRCEVHGARYRAAGAFVCPCLAFVGTVGLCALIRVVELGGHELAGMETVFLFSLGTTFLAGFVSFGLPCSIVGRPLLPAHHRLGCCLLVALATGACGSQWLIAPLRHDGWPAA